jgi:glycerol dehydrogenase
MNIEAVFFCNYSIGTDTWKEVPFVCGLYGKRILLIGGKKALRAGKERLVQAIAGTGMELVDTVIFGEDCTYENIHRWAAYAKEKQACGRI